MFECLTSLPVACRWIPALYLVVTTRWLQPPSIHQVERQTGCIVCPRLNCPIQHTGTIDSSSNSLCCWAPPAVFPPVLAIAGAAPLPGNRKYNHCGSQRLALLTVFFSSPPSSTCPSPLVQSQSEETWVRPPTIIMTCVLFPIYHSSWKCLNKTFHLKFSPLQQQPYWPAPVGLLFHQKVFFSIKTALLKMAF